MGELLSSTDHEPGQGVRRVQEAGGRVEPVLSKRKKKKACELEFFLGKEEIVAAGRSHPRERKPERSLSEVFDDPIAAFPPPGNGATEFGGLESARGPMLARTPLRSHFFLPVAKNRGEERRAEGRRKRRAPRGPLPFRGRKNKGFDLRRLTKGAWNWRCPGAHSVLRVFRRLVEVEVQEEEVERKKERRRRSHGPRRRRLLTCVVVACRQQPLTYRVERGSKEVSAGCCEPRFRAPSLEQPRL